MLDVDLEIQAGDFTVRAQFASSRPDVVALFGPSGSGKTTLANGIAGLIRPTRGHIRIGERVLFDAAAGVDLDPRLRRIGYVFQDGRLFPHLTVAGNLDYGTRRAQSPPSPGQRAEVVELLGLGPLLTRHVRGLSGGERQRVALGRALLAAPELLVLDEPLAAIDARRRAEVLPYLERMRDHFALPMLYISHQYEEVLRLADQLVLLDAGRVLACGTPAELSAHPALRQCIGSESAGAVLDVEVTEVEAATELAAVALGPTTLRFALPGARRGMRLRLMIPARDVILATRRPEHLSVRNAVEGTIVALHDEGADAVLVTVSVHGAALQSWVTRAAVAELALAPGVPVWALVKAAALHGRVFGGRP